MTILKVGNNFPKKVKDFASFVYYLKILLLLFLDVALN
jgi:hypothetical protein